jgi:hypothetical protein
MRTGWYKPFLAALSETGNITHACAIAGIAKQNVYAARDQDERFRLAWDEAMDDAVDGLKKIAWERAKQSSDKLLQWLIEVHDRSHRTGAPVTIDNRTQIAMTVPQDAKQLAEAVRILIEAGALRLEDVTPRSLNGSAGMPSLSN